MNQLLNIIQDADGQTSSTRVGKLIMILCWAFNVVMHILDPSVPEPSMVMTTAVLAVIGIGTAQKAVEGKNGKGKP